MKIRTIDRFDNPLELLRCYVPDALNDLTEEERGELLHTCDYESIALYVVNDNTVLTVDTVLGDVLGEDELFAFAAESVRWAREQASA